MKRKEHPKRTAGQAQSNKQLQLFSKWEGGGGAGHNTDAVSFSLFMRVYGKLRNSHANK